MVDHFVNSAVTPRRVLMYVNGITLLMSIGLLIASAWALQSDEQFTVPRWAIEVALSFSVIVICVSVLGFYGARISMNKIYDGERNWPLIIYFLVMLAGFVLQIYVASVMLVLYGVVTDTEDGKATNAANDFEQDLSEWMMSHPEKWVDVQTFFDCCGYNCTEVQLKNQVGTPNGCPTDATLRGHATGVFCPGNSRNNDPNNYAQNSVIYPACRSKLLEKAKDMAIMLGLMGVFLAFVQLVSMGAAYMLICCVRRKKNTGDDNNS